LHGTSTGDSQNHRTGLEHRRGRLAFAQTQRLDGFLGNRGNDGFSGLHKLDTGYL
jgi:hypothetical protein